MKSGEAMTLTAVLLPTTLIIHIDTYMKHKLLLTSGYFLPAAVPSSGSLTTILALNLSIVNGSVCTREFRSSNAFSVATSNELLLPNDV